MDVSSFTNEMLLRTNAELRGRIDELEETIRQLREADKPDDTRLPRRLPHLTGLERQLMGLLMSGRLITRDRAMNELYGLRIEEPDAKIVDVWVHKIWKKIGGGIITTLWNRGWIIDPPGMATLLARWDQ